MRASTRTLNASSWRKGAGRVEFDGDSWDSKYVVKEYFAASPGPSVRGATYLWGHAHQTLPAIPYSLIADFCALAPKMSG